MVAVQSICVMWRLVNFSVKTRNVFNGVKFWDLRVVRTHKDKKRGGRKKLSISLYLWWTISFPNHRFWAIRSIISTFLWAYFGVALEISMKNTHEIAAYRRLWRPFPAEKMGQVQIEDFGLLITSISKLCTALKLLQLVFLTSILDFFLKDPWTSGLLSYCVNISNARKITQWRHMPKEAPIIIDSAHVCGCRRKPPGFL